MKPQASLHFTEAYRVSARFQVPGNSLYPQMPRMEFLLFLTNDITRIWSRQLVNGVRTLKRAGAEQKLENAMRASHRVDPLSILRPFRVARVLKKSRAQRVQKSLDERNTLIGYWIAARNTSIENALSDHFIDSFIYMFSTFYFASFVLDDILDRKLYSIVLLLKLWIVIIRLRIFLQFHVLIKKSKEMELVEDREKSIYQFE